jgi:hypothetical protein
MKMENTTSAEDPIEKLLATGRFSEHDLKRIYKILCKSTHPDVTGKDHAHFIRVQEVYQDALHKCKTDPRGPLTGFDPYKVVYDTGFSGALNARACLYVCLYRYNTHDLYSFKIRANPALRERNSRILRSILYWASVYNPEFIPLFIRLNTNVIRDIKTITTIRQYSLARRLLVRGMDLFFQYQEKGRPSSKNIAEEKLLRCVYLLGAIGCGKHPMVDLAHWLLEELALEPVYVVTGNHIKN